ncbi:MAG: type V CRISPR-associated protein Cas4 [Bacteroidales bacterium]|nr:type V CRISPR-associated protein Cas4 [Bacteroidales bacterium]
MNDYILISNLNDFIFCPYSIYLHNVYMETDEELYHAKPQTKGKIAHKTIDEKTSTSKNEIQSLPVSSDELGIMGKIDVYKPNEKTLIERKYKIKQIYRGQLYQIWAQYFCMKEMGYEVENLAFYEISTNKTISLDLPTEIEKNELESFIDKFKMFDPSESIQINENKCRHCVYSNLCDKTSVENVYQ